MILGWGKAEKYNDEDLKKKYHDMYSKGVELMKCFNIVKENEHFPQSEHEKVHKEFRDTLQKKVKEFNDSCKELYERYSEPWLDSGWL